MKKHLDPIQVHIQCPKETKESFQILWETESIDTKVMNRLLRLLEAIRSPFMLEFEETEHKFVSRSIFRYTATKDSNSFSLTAEFVLHLEGDWMITEISNGEDHYQISNWDDYSDVVSEIKDKIRVAVEDETL